jgi:hypothetical protein
MCANQTQYPDEPFLRYNKSIAIAKKHPVNRAPTAGFKNVFQNFIVRFYPEFLFLVCRTKAALVVGTSHRYLQQQAAGLTGWPNYVSFVFHILTLE